MDINLSPDILMTNSEFLCREKHLKRFSTDDEDVELPDLTDHPRLIDYVSMDPTCSAALSLIPPFHLKMEVQIELDELEPIKLTEASTCIKEEREEMEENFKGIKTGVKVAPKECLICGYPTTCLHYEAPSCHACKTFFRRSCLSGANYTCKLQAKCIIKSGVRCRSCRYDQCFRAGMDPDSIRFVDDPAPYQLAALQIAKHRQTKLLKEKAKWDKENQVQLKFLPHFDQTTDSRAVEFLNRLEIKYNRLRESTYTAEEFYDSSIRELLRSKCQFGMAEKFERTSEWPNQINCLRANKPQRNWFIFDLILNLEYLKAMPFFHELDIDDQETQVMHVVMVNTVLSEAWYSYEHSFTTKVMPDGTLPITMRANFNVNKFYPNAEQIELDTFCNNIDPLYRVIPSEEEYYLLKAIIFCHSETPGLSLHASTLLDAHRQVFSSALLRRLQARMGTLEGARKYSDLINLIQTYFHYGQKHREFQVFVKYVCERAKTPRKLPSLTDWFIKNSSKFD